MFSFQEPFWGKDLVRYLYTLMQQHDYLLYSAPIFSDIFVFTYPFFLIGMYLMGVIQKNLQTKLSALFVFFCVFFSSLVTILVQIFVNKQRPIYAFGFAKESTQTLLHQFLPSTSFPSDHATISMAMATAMRILFANTKNTRYKIFAIVLTVFALIMGFGRVMTAVHRPTDIIAGFSIGIFVPFLLSYKLPNYFIDTYLSHPLVRLEEWLIQQAKKMLSIFPGKDK